MYQRRRWDVIDESASVTDVLQRAFGSVPLKLKPCSGDGLPQPARVGWGNGSDGALALGPEIHRNTRNPPQS